MAAIVGLAVALADAAADFGLFGYQSELMFGWFKRKKPVSAPLPPPATSEANVVDELTQQVVDAAAQAVVLCESRPGGGLDFTEASLTVVEEMLAEAAQYAANLTPGQLLGLAQQFGSYILEVGRREFGGRYLWHDEREQPVLVVGEPMFRIAMIAWDKVRGRVGGDEADNIPFFYAGFADRARMAKPGEDAMYV